MITLITILFFISFLVITVRLTRRLKKREFKIALGVAAGGFTLQIMTKLGRDLTGIDVSLLVGAVYEESWKGIYLLRNGSAAGLVHTTFAFAMMETVLKVAFLASKPGGFSDPSVIVPIVSTVHLHLTLSLITARFGLKAIPLCMLAHHGYNTFGLALFDSGRFVLLTVMVCAWAAACYFCLYRWQNLWKTEELPNANASSRAES